MKKILSILLALIFAFSFAINAFAAMTGPEALAAVTTAKAAFENNAKTKFDVNKDGKITAKDARDTLVYSAGLSQGSLDTSKMDADIDGSVTAIDARTILRISAGLEAVQDYMYSEMLTYFNAILNTAKPENYYTYFNGIEQTQSVSYTDPKGVVKALDDAFENIDDTFSFEESLVGSANVETYDSTSTMVGSVARAKNRMMNIANAAGVNEDISSYLTINDVSKIVYEKNQSYTFTRYGKIKNADGVTVIDRNNKIYSQTVNGLDALTVYIKTDNNVNGTHASKAFTVYKQSDIESDVNKIAEQFNNMSMEMTQLYQIEFDVTPSVGGVKYHNGFIKIYFNPTDGKIVSAQYSLDTDYTIGLYMDVKIFLALPYVNVDKEGLVSITNSNRTIKEYYFIQNNPNHVPWVTP